MIFDDSLCYIKDKSTTVQVVAISMTKNMMFPLESSGLGHCGLATSVQKDSLLRYLRYGHLNIKGLKLLH